MRTRITGVLYGVVCAAALVSLAAGMQWGFRVSAVGLVASLIGAMVLRAGSGDCEEVWACGRGRVPDLLLLGALALLIVVVFPGIPLTAP